MRQREFIFYDSKLPTNHQSKPVNHRFNPSLLSTWANVDEKQGENTCGPTLPPPKPYQPGRDRLMFLLSSNCCPVASVFDWRSLPARSTMVMTHSMSRLSGWGGSGEGRLLEGATTEKWS